MRAAHEDDPRPSTAHVKTIVDREVLLPVQLVGRVSAIGEAGRGLPSRRDMGAREGRGADVSRREASVATDASAGEFGCREFGLGSGRSNAGLKQG